MLYKLNDEMCDLADVPRSTYVSLADIFKYAEKHGLSPNERRRLFSPIPLDVDELASDIATATAYIEKRIVHMKVPMTFGGGPICPNDNCVVWEFKIEPCMFQPRWTERVAPMITDEFLSEMKRIVEVLSDGEKNSVGIQVGVELCQNEPTRALLVNAGFEIDDIDEGLQFAAYPACSF